MLGKFGDSRKKFNQRLQRGVISLVLLTGCSAPEFDPSTTYGAAAILDQVNIYLSVGDCSGARELSKKLYDSDSTSNEARYAWAAANACSAGISDLMEFLSSILESSSDIAGPGLWKLLSTMSYVEDSSLTDNQRNEQHATRMVHGWSASDALFSVIGTGTAPIPSNLINSDTLNPGSIDVSDRLANANLFNIFVSMSVIGNAQNRFGDPNPETFLRRQELGQTAANPLGWKQEEFIDDSACGYAGAVVNLIDNIGNVSENLEGSVKETMESISETFGEAIDFACNLGCQGTGGPALIALDTGAACVFAADICVGADTTRPCLAALRNRTFCSTRDPDTDLDERVRCAAAGVINLISSEGALGWAPEP